MSQPNAQAAPVTARNTDLEQIAGILRTQQITKLDVVAPATALYMSGGNLVLSGMEHILDDNGVTDPNGEYNPTQIFDQGAATRLGIPAGYYNRMRANNIDLLDLSVNSWLRHADNSHNHYLIRAFRNLEGGPGTARAMLSDVYRPIDHLDVLVAALDGVRNAGVHTTVDSCDLSERRMRIRLACPEIRALAPTLLRGYRPGFDIDQPRAGGWTLESARNAANREGKQYEPGTEPVVFAGFEIGNSETGHGKFSITPRLIVQACRNGLRIEVDAFATQHLGAKLSAGVVRWSDDTLARNLALVTAQTRDAVTQFCDPRYAQGVIDRLEKDADRPVDEPEATMKVVGQKLQFSEAQREDVLRHFILGGQPTCGGVLNAITSAAQFVADPDEAAAMESKAVQGMQVAASLAG